MSNKRKISIDLIFVIYMIGATIFTILQQIDFSVIKQGFEEYNGLSPTNFIVLVLICMILTIVKNIYIIIIYIGIKIGSKIYRKERLTENDFQKNKDYYREIIQGYSPAVLSFIDNFEIGYPNTIIATLLQLRKNNLIKMDNGILEKNPTADFYNIKLEDNEKYVYDNIKNNKVKLKVSEFTNKTIQDALNKGLLENIKDIKDKKKKRILKAIISIIIIYGASFIIFNSIEEIDIQNQILMMIIFLVLAILLLAVVFYPMALIISYIVYLVRTQKCPYVRTKKGEDINKKLEGLKSYLIDYSLLENKKENEIVIWEEYLVYSVLFNQNTQIIEKYKQNIELE